MARYRLYIDESGTHKYPKHDVLWEKCLGLTGIIISAVQYETVLQPGLREIKKLFSDDVDNLPILHREEIALKSGPFKRLESKEFEVKYNDLFLRLISGADYTICTVVIDKKAHKEQYSDPEHPYHYCLTLMLERYVDFLKNKEATGDVMAESRGGSEDRELKKIYSEFYENGTNYRRPKLIQGVLSSKEIKMKRKSDAIEGLEFADLLSIPSKVDVLHTFGKTDLRENFNKKIIEAIQGKYYRNWMGTIKGYGKKIC